MRVLFASNFAYSWFTIHHPSLILCKHRNEMAFTQEPFWSTWIESLTFRFAFLFWNKPREKFWHLFCMRSFENWANHASNRLNGLKYWVWLRIVFIFNNKTWMGSKTRWVVSCVEHLMRKMDGRTKETKKQTNKTEFRLYRTHYKNRRSMSTQPYHFWIKHIQTKVVSKDIIYVFCFWSQKSTELANIS